MSSNDLRKYEYLTSEDLGNKPRVVERAKFDYSPLGKIFNKRLTKEDQKEGLLKSVKNIGDKNEELLEVFSAAKKVSKAAKNESDFSYNPKYAFTDFTETLKSLIEWYQ